VRQPPALPSTFEVALLRGRVDREASLRLVNPSYGLVQLGQVPFGDGRSGCRVDVGGTRAMIAPATSAVRRASAGLRSVYVVGLTLSYSFSSYSIDRPEGVSVSPKRIERLAGRWDRTLNVRGMQQFGECLGLLGLACTRKPGAGRRQRPDPLHQLAWSACASARPGSKSPPDAHGLAEIRTSPFFDQLASQRILRLEPVMSTYCAIFDVVAQVVQNAARLAHPRPI